MKYIILLLFVCPQLVLACSCQAPDLYSLLSQSKNIWQVKINSIDESYDYKNSSKYRSFKKVNYTVLKSLKGEGTKSGFFITEDDMCFGFTPKIGEELIFFKAENGIEVHGCGNQSNLRNLGDKSLSLKEIEAIATNERAAYLSERVRSIIETCQNQKEQTKDQCLSALKERVNKSYCNSGSLNPTECNYFIGQ